MIKFKKMKIYFLVPVVLISLLGLFYLKDKKNNSLPAPIGYGYKKKQLNNFGKSDISNFALLDQNGNFKELFRQTDSEIVVLLSQSNNCDSTLEQIRNIQLLKNKYPLKSIAFFLINSDLNQNRQLLISLSDKYKSDIPILLDDSQIVAQALGINFVNETIILNTKNWKVIFHGAANPELKNIDLVLNSFFNNRKINITDTQNNKCEIEFKKNNHISYQNEIAPILMNKCLVCHSKEGRILPNFDSYEKVKNWTAMSKETILTQRMPPISYDPMYGEYLNDISLTKEEKKLLITWFSEGALKTGNIDPIKTYKPKQERKVNKEDFLYSAKMKEPHRIPPGGEIEYKYFQIGDAIPFDMWIQAYKTISTNPRQLHHESLMITSKPLRFYEELARKKFKIDDEQVAQNKDGDVFLYTLRAMEKYEHKFASDTYLRAQIWGAGRKEENFYPFKVNAFAPKGSFLILETHYMGTGKEETEQSTIEFYGKKTKPENVNAIHSYSLVNSDFEIPANTKNFEVRSHFWSPKKRIKLVSFLGHLHMRGQSVRMDLTDKTGKSRTIISIPNFYYGWQTGSSLRPANAIFVNPSDKLQTICHFDNSKHNPFNPDPNKLVRFGQRVDRTEMCKMNFGFIYKD
jgi:hypothetical protein